MQCTRMCLPNCNRVPKKSFITTATGAGCFSHNVDVALQGFDAYVGFESFWLKHLPKKIPPQTCPQFDSFAAACNHCECLSASCAVSRKADGMRT
jgi:hypothetical protein